ncbi:MAG: hypothetical protein ACE5KD_00310 [Candidatus Bathyarchaeia archaeon]
MSGLGLILIMWGLASVVALPSSSSTIYIGIILLGVILFATGSCREAYLRGSLSVQPSIYKKTPIKSRQHATTSKPADHSQITTTQSVHHEPTDLNQVTTEQIKEYSVGTETQEAVLYEQSQ